ncbi:MAG: glycosyltransferase [Ekhidna sp.]|uniref:glycosyltransferase n=1 Tax=Ekhidna sp. TaxID=2608089 RepID=UPI0032EB65EE
MKVLHITSWHPNRGQPKEALFIHRQVEALNEFVDDQKVIHAQVLYGKLRFIRYQDYGAHHVLLQIPTRRWIIIEVFSSLLVLFVLLRNRANSYDVLNFHIAYPNLTYWHLFKGFFKPKTVITEHWSAYHFNFGLKKSLPRVQRIFKQNIPVITVSKALGNDIKQFSGYDFVNFIVPNVVENDFKRLSLNREKGRFFMVSLWKSPKDPFIVINAFVKLLDFDPSIKLVIAGYGPQWEEIVQLSQPHNQIELLGKLDSAEIARQMNMASAYIHPSVYETFSVVCAEALMCGCPVIASHVGGIPEFVNASNGVLIENNSEDDFFEAMYKLINGPMVFNEVPDFSKVTIGKKYFDVLQHIISQK